MISEKRREYNKLYMRKRRENETLEEREKRLFYIRKAYKENSKVYYQNTKLKRKIRHLNKYKTDINYKLQQNLRKRLTSALKGNYKTGSAVKDLGCSVEEFKIYLESKWELGMSWDNYGRGRGKWNIDHIIPLSFFNLQDLQQFKKANHFSNLQPMWSLQNTSKGGKNRK